MQRRKMRMMLAGGLMLALSGCGTSGPGSAAALRRIVGTDLIGARGATAEDQRRIDRTAVGLCAGGVWTRQECGQHGGGR
ncbi:hypothetical protein [Allorhizobium borbori]|uniref:hypothetical protein n=1 Tax=Allorhizobium borbori TaxID=485907 RepID=UPI001F420EBF|nr:hypothetical protein [Allorhizobium borbori]